jgi:hypothetical protein
MDTKAQPHISFHKHMK